MFFNISIHSIEIQLNMMHIYQDDLYMSYIYLNIFHI